MKEIIRASVMIAGNEDIIQAETVGQELASTLGFSTANQARFVTSISELTRNALDYAERGVCTFSSKMENGRPIIRLVVSDEGAGIPDLALALSPGFSTSSGLGQGLPAVRRLMGNLTIDSRPGRTVIETIMRSEA
jgi:serine/threonine-protein kinase RsbT